MLNSVLETLRNECDPWIWNISSRCKYFYRNVHFSSVGINLTGGMSCYSEHLSTNLNISQQEPGSVVIFSTYVICGPGAIYPW